ncbi:hypothetical protein [Streptomyces hyaluromycini]|uniref:hypothetical protein n=1 Tax=Streptomyces hyaluromycini TaxID=1377993 RepID=UPI003D9DF4BD
MRPSCRTGVPQGTGFFPRPETPVPHRATGFDLPVTPLLSVSATAPDPAELRPLLAALGTELDLSEGPVSLSFTVGTPHGPVTFG